MPPTETHSGLLSAEKLVQRGSPSRSAPEERVAYVEVEDVAETLRHAERVGYAVLQPARNISGVIVGLFADAGGHTIGAWSFDASLSE